MSAKSPSVSRSRSRAVASPPQRRITIFERKEIIEGLSPVVIEAIQREIIEMTAEFEQKLDICERKGDRRLGEVLQLASNERLDIEKLRWGQTKEWEDASESVSRQGAK